MLSLQTEGGRAVPALSPSPPYRCPPYRCPPYLPADHRPNAGGGFASASPDDLAQLQLAIERTEHLLIDLRARLLRLCPPDPDPIDPPLLPPTAEQIARYRAELDAAHARRLAEDATSPAIDFEPA